MGLTLSVSLFIISYPFILPFPFLSGFLPFFLSNYFFTHSIPPFLFVTILEPCFLCLCPFVVFTLHSFFPFFIIWISFSSPLNLFYAFPLVSHFSLSFFPFLPSFLFPFLSFFFSSYFLSCYSVYLPQYLLLRAIKIYCLTCTSFFAIAEDTQMEKVFGITVLR